MNAGIQYDINTELAHDQAISPRGRKSIRLPITPEYYNELMKDAPQFRRFVDEQFQQHPELFPDEMTTHYQLYGFIPPSAKLGIKIRRIQIIPNDTRSCYGIYPSFVMPYMAARVEDAEAILFLSRFGVPYWALGYVFKRDAMWCYRLVRSLGRCSIVGTTVKDEDALPVHLVADEKHSRRLGDKCYVATTAAEECILGASVASQADTKHLQRAYGVFQKEAFDIEQDYQPKTVNTDGWSATQQAWKALFSSITVIECFLHAFLKIKAVARVKTQTLFQEVGDRVWDVYDAPSRAAFSQRIRRLQDWALEQSNCPIIQNVLKLCRKKIRFAVAYSHPNAYRTSNQVDRLMDGMDRFLFSARYFHGTAQSAELSIRAYALLHNFTPSCPKVVKKYNGQLSPMERLNGFRYHDNWLQNLLISASRNGFRGSQQNPL